MSTPQDWRVIPSPTDPEMSAVQGVYLVADNLPIEDANLIAAAPALIEALEEARTTLSLTRTNIMVEIGRCADPSESRWEGVPELLKERLNQIDAALSLAKGGQA